MWNQTSTPMPGWTAPCRPAGSGSSSSMPPESQDPGAPIAIVRTRRTWTIWQNSKSRLIPNAPYHPGGNGRHPRSSRLASYHRRVLTGYTPNTSMTLTRKPSGWWLTLTVNEPVAATTTTESPVVGVDVGIANFLTTSTGKRYGTFRGKLARRHQRDREKRRRKAKLRACLKKKGVTRLPSLTDTRLARHVRQEINRAVNQFYADHVGHQVAYEDLDVRTMRFKARRANAYLYASNLAHLPRQITWGAKKRGQTAQAGWAAYSSQECSRCHFVSRANRPEQQTFCCQACGFQLNADENAAINHQARFHDRDMRAGRSKEEVKALLDARHVAFAQSQGHRSWPSRREPAFGCESVSGQSGVGHYSGSRRRKHPPRAS